MSEPNKVIDMVPVLTEMLELRKVGLTLPEMKHRKEVQTRHCVWAKNAMTDAIDELKSAIRHAVDPDVDQALVDIQARAEALMVRLLVLAGERR